eukprot:1332831-Pyramimonas_sp.AAC.1
MEGQGYDEFNLDSTKGPNVASRWGRACAASEQFRKYSTKEKGWEAPADFRAQLARKLREAWKKNVKMEKKTSMVNEEVAKSEFCTL